MFRSLRHFNPTPLTPIEQSPSDAYQSSTKTTTTIQGLSVKEDELSQQINFDQVEVISKWGPLPIEFIEQQMGDMIKMRNATVFKYASLGVPDMCVLYKRRENSQLTTPVVPITQSSDQDRLIGYFHWVFGQDVSSAMSMSVYMTQLIHGQEMEEVERNTSWLFGRPAVDHKCEKAIYCCYNFLSRYDLRVEITLPGTVKYYVIDESGTISDQINEEMWTETLLCSHLRYEQMVSSDDYQSNLPENVRILDPLILYYDSVAEDVLIEQAIRSFPKGINTRVTNVSTSGIHGSQLQTQDEERCTSVNNAFMYAMRDHFLRNCQYQQALSFFNTLMVQNEMVTVHISEILRQMGDVEDAEALITDHLLREEKNIDLLVEECRSVILHHRSKTHKSGKTHFEHEYVLSLARAILQNSPSKILPWLNIAEMYALMGNVEKAISCLNIITMPPDPEPATTKDFFCFYSANVNVSCTRTMDQKKKETTAVPLWFSVDHYTNGEYVYNSTTRESHTKQELLRLKGNKKLIQDIHFTQNNSVHKVFLDDPLVTDFNIHSLQSCSSYFRQKVLRTYVYGVLLDLKDLVGFQNLMQRVNALFKPQDRPVSTTDDSARSDDTKPPITVIFTDTKDDAQPIVVTFHNNTVTNNSETTTDQSAVCQPWLREMLDILMQDLVELNIWMNDNTPMTSSDWYYRGRMSERLNLIDHAINAYKHSVAQAFHLKGYQRLLSLSSSKHTEVSDKNIEECFILVEALLSFYLHGVSILSVPENARWNRLHPCVRKGMFALVAKYGLKRVRRVFHADHSPCRSFTPKCMFMVQELLLECVVNKTYGFDM